METEITEIGRTYFSVHYYPKYIENYKTVRKNKDKRNNQNDKQIYEMVPNTISETLWTVVYHAPPSMGFSRQEYWSGLPFPSPGDLPDTGIKPGSPTLEADALTSEPPGKPIRQVQFNSVTQSCLTLCNPMNCTMLDLFVHHQHPEFTKIHVH